jgi:protein disulfide-isomerase
MIMKTLPLALAAIAFATTSVFAKPGWEDDFDKGLAKAKTEKKVALVDFTGSDWCGWCIKLDKEIFSQSKFQDYAKDKLVLVEVDFPRSKPLPKEKQEKHDALMKKYKVEGFPTVLVFNAEGKQVGELGYTKGGPDAFIAELEKVLKK